MFLPAKMAIEPVCDKCKSRLDDFGGLLFSPPDDEGKVKKWHLCRKCYEAIVSKL